MVYILCIGRIKCIVYVVVHSSKHARLVCLQYSDNFRKDAKKVCSADKRYEKTCLIFPVTVIYVRTTNKIKMHQD